MTTETNANGDDDARRRAAVSGNAKTARTSAGRALARLRWKRTTAEERKVIGEKLTAARMRKRAEKNAKEL